MTITSTTTKAVANGNGSTTVFSWGFLIPTQADLEVVKTAADGTETVQTVGVDYSVTGLGDANGGSITMVTAPASGTKVTIRRLSAIQQQTDLTNSAAFYAEVHEAVFDRLTMICQEQQEQLDRAVKVAVSSSVDPEDYLTTVGGYAAAAASSASTAATQAGLAAAAKSAAETAQAAAEAAAAAADVAKIEWKGAWSGATAYALNDAVSYGGASWICVQPHTNQSPADNAYWDVLSAKGDTGATGATGATGPTGPTGPQGPAGTGTGDMLAANNLSDLTSASAARTNLGLSIVAATGSYGDLTGKPTLGTSAAQDIETVRQIPQNSQSAAYTLVLGDAGKHILHPSADTTARIFTIPANASVAYPIGTAITFVNQNGAGSVSIAITSDTMRLAGAGTTGTRTLAANGVATALKVTSTEWIISGAGLT